MRLLHLGYRATTACCVPILLLCFTFSAHGQVSGALTGKVKNSKNELLANVIVTTGIAAVNTLTDGDGYFKLNKIPYGTHTLVFSHVSYEKLTVVVRITERADPLEIQLSEREVVLEEAKVVTAHSEIGRITRLLPVQGTIINAGKKNEVITLSGVNANLAVNNSRQVFAKVAGINIWENDGSGIQTNISTRGLSPNRSWEFNNRQNGNDIQADVMGYPDTYYTPPLEAVSRIEVIRGAASLQYGTQLGGVVNYVIKEAETYKPLQVELKQTKGSYNLFNSYNALSGRRNKWSYYGYFHHRSADGWRQNANYNWNTAYASFKYDPNPRLSVKAEVTSMRYLLHLSAGLTDSLFRVNPRVSLRNRNWFEVNWLLPALHVNWKVNDHLRLSSTNFLLAAQRNSIEVTLPMNLPDDGRNRDLRKDAYLNGGSELRALLTHKLSPGLVNHLSVGVRLYRGTTTRGQGLGTQGSDPNFAFINPSHLEYNDYRFSSRNVAFFAENLLKVGKRISIIPGIRQEFITFTADGYYSIPDADKAYESAVSSRRFPLLGLGFEYKLNGQTNFYSNFSQGYRAINFNDIRVTNPNVVVDKNMQDSRGWNFDGGFRGNYKGMFFFDANVFYLSYNRRVGVVSQQRPDGTEYLYSTNAADSRSVGMESLVEVNVMRLLNISSPANLSLSAAYSYVDAKYTNAQQSQLVGKEVEYAPRNILRCGATFRLKELSTTLNYSYVDRQFSDAGNLVTSVSGNAGIIPQYQVWDWSLNYRFQNYSLGTGLNNALNRTYFTRRASAYPGPGLIPAEPRTFYITLGVSI